MTYKGAYQGRGCQNSVLQRCVGCSRLVLRKAVTFGAKLVSKNATLLLFVFSPSYRNRWAASASECRRSSSKQSVCELSCCNSFYYRYYYSQLKIMTEKVTARCSWAQTAGKELQQVIPTRHSDEDVFEKLDKGFPFTAKNCIHAQTGLDTYLYI